MPRPLGQPVASLGQARPERLLERDDMMLLLEYLGHGHRQLLADELSNDTLRIDP